MDRAHSLTRWRRPFLAPIWLAILLVAVVAAAAWTFLQSAATTTVIVVRPPNDGLPSIPDPPLAADGEEQAERLARLFGVPDAPERIEAIYVAGTRRLEQLVAPLAARLGLHPIVFPVAGEEEIPGRALDEHRGESVMIVAGGSAAAEMVEGLSGVKVDRVHGEEYGQVYIVSVPALGSAGVLELRF